MHPKQWRVVGWGRGQGLNIFLLHERGLQSSLVINYISKYLHQVYPLQHSHPTHCHKSSLNGCRWEYTLINRSGLASSICSAGSCRKGQTAWAVTQPSWRKPRPLWFLAPPSFQHGRATARTPCYGPEQTNLLLSLHPWPGPEWGRSEEVTASASFAFYGCCCSWTLRTHRTWWNLAAENLVFSPRRGGRWLALLHGTEGVEQPTSFIPRSKKLFCLWPCGCEIKFFLNMLTDGSRTGRRKIVNEQEGNAWGGLPLLSPRSFRAALWRGCWQQREWALCCHREGDGSTLAICEHLWDSSAFNAPLGWVRSVHTSNLWNKVQEILSRKPGKLRFLSCSSENWPITSTLHWRVRSCPCDLHSLNRLRAYLLY